MTQQFTTSQRKPHQHASNSYKNPVIGAACPTSSVWCPWRLVPVYMVMYGVSVTWSDDDDCDYWLKKTIFFVSRQMPKRQPTKRVATRASSCCAWRQAATSRGWWLQSATVNMESSALARGAPLTQEPQVDTPPAGCCSWCCNWTTRSKHPVQAAVKVHLSATMHPPAATQEVPGPSTVSPRSAHPQEVAQFCITMQAAINTHMTGLFPQPSASRLWSSERLRIKFGNGHL